MVTCATGDGDPPHTVVRLSPGRRPGRATHLGERSERGSSPRIHRSDDPSGAASPQGSDRPARVTPGPRGGPKARTCAMSAPTHGETGAKTAQKIDPGPGGRGGAE